MRHASMQMEDEAYNWYMWWKKMTHAISWKKFKMHSLRRSMFSKKKSYPQH